MELGQRQSGSAGNDSSGGRGACPDGLADCDNNTDNGCETPLNLTTHCGGCGVVCDPTNATGNCDSGECVLECDDGFADCDNNTSNGCESNATCTPGPCDAALAIDSDDPLDAAKAIGICTSVTSASWVLPDGNPPPGDPDFDLGHGILTGFGPNVNVQEGSALLALSSGTARQPNDPGYKSVNGFSKGYQSGHPQGFPKESPACPGTTTGTPNDGTGLELELSVPSFATAFAFDFKFYTYGWPSYICSTFNDFFVALLSPIPQGQTDGNVSFDSQGNPMSVNNGFLQVCGCTGGPPCSAGGKTFDCPYGNTELMGTGFGADTAGADHGATPWLATEVPAVPNSAVTLRFATYDSGDGVLDSTVLIDNFRWLSTSVSAVTSTVVPNPQ